MVHKTSEGSKLGPGHSFSGSVTTNLTNRTNLGGVTTNLTNLGGVTTDVTDIADWGGI